MPILARLAAPREVKAAGQGATALTPMSTELIRRLGSRTASGKSVTEDAALAISTAWSCMRILAETIGAIPWSLYRRDLLGNAEKADDHWLQELLTASPNRDMTSAEFREAKVLNLCANGNTYSLIERLLDGQVTSLYPLRAANVTPLRKQGSNTQLPIRDGEVFYKINDRGVTEDVPREKIWHVKGFGFDGLVGLSPIGAAREALGVALATEEFGARFFSQGGMPSGTVTVPGWLTEDQRKLARNNLQQMLGGLGNAHQFALFEGGMKPEPWGEMNLDDMQFLLLRRFSVQEICRFYRIPPHMVADLERATFSNIEHLSLEFVTFTLMPYFTRFEAAVARWLLPPEERVDHFLRFNFEGLLRADSKGRGEFYSSALQNGWMSRNEVRAKENLNRVKGLDDYTVQTNLAPASRLGEMVDSQTRGERDKGTTLIVAAPPAATPATLNMRIPERVEQKITHEQPAVTALAGSVERLAVGLTAERQQSEEKVSGLLDRLSSLIAAICGFSTEVREAGERNERSISALAGEIAGVAKSLDRPRKGIIVGKDTPDEAIYSVPVDRLELH